MYFRDNSPYKGMSIHIGLNAINPSYYHFEGRLKGCENDAKYMSEIAVGYESVKLLGSEGNANVKDVRDAILEASAKLDDNGILFISFSGHGGQIPARNEPDGRYETWCLYDKPMSDREFFGVLTLGRFKRTQRILVISDSCHSGTITGNVPAGFDGLLDHTVQFLSSFFQVNNELAETGDAVHSEVDERLKFIPNDTLKAVYNTDKPYYEKKQAETDSIFKTINPNKDYRELLEASVLLISACQDWQLAKDGEIHGIFTQALKDLLSSGHTMNYVQLHNKLWNKLENTGQNPNYYRIGTPNADFEMQPCFTI